MKRNKLLEKTGIILIVCLSIFLFSGHLFAATYYIDYNAANDSAKGTSKSTPWKRSPGMKGFAGSYVHSNGDVFVFKGGVTWPAAAMPLSIANSGGTNTPDVYMGGQQCGFSPTAIVVCNGSTTPCGSNASVSCNGGAAWGSGYPVFDGESVGYLGLFYGGDGGSLRSNYVIDGIKTINVGSAGGGNENSIWGNGNNIEVKNNAFVPNALTPFVSGCEGGIGKLYIHDNYMSEYGRVHISCGDNTFDDIKIYNNLFESVVWTNPVGYHTDGVMIGADGVGSFKMTNVKIYNNKWYGDWSASATGQIFFNGSSGNYSAQHIYIYNNILTIENTSGSALSPGFMVFYSGTMHVDDVYIYNNTIEGRSKQPGACIFAAGTLSNFTIKNNILSGCDNALSIDTIPTWTFIYDSNLFYSNTRLLTGMGNMYQTCAQMQAGGDSKLLGPYGTTYCSVSNPSFVALTDGTNGSANLHLQSSSPAKGHGQDLSGVFTTDYAGITRPRGRAWDIGAYKFPPEPPTNLRIVP